MPIRLKARSKYHAVPTTVGGIRFASKREAARYQELRLLEKAGEIYMLELQPVFVLRCPGFRDVTMCTEDIGKYVADFSYVTHRDYPAKGECVVEDCKGFRTPLYKWKKRHVEAQYGIVVKET